MSLRHCRLSLVKRMLYGLSNILKRETREGRQQYKTAEQFMVSERRFDIGELRSSGGAVACRLVEFTLRMVVRIVGLLPDRRQSETISRCDLVDVLLRRLVRLARHPLAGRNSAISVRLVRRMAL